MTLQTKLPGSLIQSGSVPVSAITNFTGELTASLPSGTVSSSAQVTAYLPSDTVSSSVQVTAFLPVGTVSSSTQLPSGIASSSAQVIAYLPSDTVSSSIQVTAFLPSGTISSSAQLPSGIASSSAQVIAYLPTGTVSQSSQVVVQNTTGISAIATTGSNTFTGIQEISNTTNSTSYLDGALTVAGGMSVRKDVRVSGSMTVNGLLTAVSMSTQYVTSSQYNIGVSKITLNDDDNVRFAGLSIYDSGSSSPTTASIFWDSLQHRFIYENLSGSSYNSSILMAGPKHTGSLGDEVGLTSGYIPYATGGDHIDNSVMFQSSSNIGIGITTPNYKLHIKGDNNTTPLYIEVGANARYQFSGNSTSGYTTTFNITDTGLSIGHNSADRDFRLQTNSTPRITITGADGYVGIGTTNPGYYRLQVQGNTYITGSLTVGTSDAGVTSYFYTYQNSTLGATPNIWVVARGFLNDYAQIGFGYPIGTQPPVVIGSQVTSQAGSTKGNFIIATRDVTTDTAPTIRMLIDTAGNVGIGTTNPTSAKMVVYGTTETNYFDVNASNGAAGLSNDNGAMARFINSSDGATVLIKNNDSTRTDAMVFSVWNQTNPRLIILNNGNIGVGTTVADALLEISKAITFTSVDTYPQLIVKASGGSTGRRLNLAVDDTNNVAFIQAVNRGTDVINLSLQRYGGNVGIGTTSPVTKLDVRGSIASSYSAATYATFDSSTDGNLYITANAGAANVSISTIFRSSTAGGAVTERMRIDSSGNVGIGTTNPFARLHVRDSNTSTGTIAIGHANYPGLIYSNAGTGEFRLDNRSSAAGGYITFYPNGQENTVGSEALRIDAALNIYTPGGSPISYGSGETYTIWSSEPEATAVSNDANWKNMKTFVCSKSGTLKFKFSAYISSGTYYWAWRILKNGATVVASGHYNSGLDTGETTSVHAYRRFVATVGPIAAGDSLVLQMISASGGGTPVTGNGQTLYAKEFRAYSTVPSVEHGGVSNIWGDRIGIGTITPSKKLEINFTASGDGLLVTGPQRLNGVFQSTGEHSWVYIDSAHSNIYLPALWLQRTSTTYGSVRLQRASNSDSLGAYVESEMIVGTETNTPFSLQTNAVRRMVITDGGNVGVGTTNPSTRLHINGALIVDNSNNTDRTLQLDGNGQTREYVRTGTQVGDTTLRVDVAFGSQGTNWNSHLVEISIATSDGDSSTRYGGVIRYVVTSLNTGTGLQGPTGLTSDLTGLSASTAISGNTLQITFTASSGTIDYYAVHVKVVSSWGGAGMSSTVSIN